MAAVGQLNDIESIAARAADITGLRNINIPAERSLAVVNSLPPTLFFFDNESTAADDGSTIIKPNHLGPTEPGRWSLLGGVGSGGTFVGLTDTPGNYTGAGNSILTVNSGETAVEFASSVPVRTQELAFFDELPVRSLDTSSSDTRFVEKAYKHFNVVDIGNITTSWDKVFQHLNWMITGYPSLTRLGPVKFVTFAAFVAYLKANLPLTGISFADGVVKIEGYDDVNANDPYPMTRRSRNSMVASMKGRNRWIGTSPGKLYDLDPGFHHYYSTALSTNLAAHLVSYFTGVMPGTTDNRAIWYTRSRKTRWSFPKHATVGTQTSVKVGAGLRGAAWDIVAGAWVTPAPAALYDFEAQYPALPAPATALSPILLYERAGAGNLSLGDQQDASNQENQMEGVCALAFPVLGNNRYLSFVVYPYGADTFYTEWLDPALYVLQARINYRGRKSPRYNIIPTTSSDQRKISMFNIFGGGGSYIFPTGGSYGQAYQQSIDNNFIPIGVDICRRNVNTGDRSPWVALLKVSRRIPHANIHIKPHHSWG